MLGFVAYVVIVGSSKLMLHYAGVQSKQAKKMRVEEITKNVWGVLGSKKAWYATYPQSPYWGATMEKCYPGRKQTNGQ